MDQVMALTQCLIAAEIAMRDFTKADEVASIVAENNEQARKAIKAFHHFLLGVSYNGTENTTTAYHEYIPFQRIVDTIHFATKRLNAANCRFNCLCSGEVPAGRHPCGRAI